MIVIQTWSVRARAYEKNAAIWINIDKLDAVKMRRKKREKLRKGSDWDKCNKYEKMRKRERWTRFAVSYFEVLLLTDTQASTQVCQSGYVRCALLFQASKPATASFSSTFIYRKIITRVSNNIHPLPRNCEEKKKLFQL